MSELFEVTITTDIIRNGNNLGGTSTFRFDDKEELTSYLKDLFRGRNPSFVSEMALFEDLYMTLTASVYKDNAPVDIKELIC